MSLLAPRLSIRRNPADYSQMPQEDLLRALVKAAAKYKDAIQKSGHALRRLDNADPENAPAARKTYEGLLPAQARAMKAFEQTALAARRIPAETIEQYYRSGQLDVTSTSPSEDEIRAMRLRHHYDVPRTRWTPVETGTPEISLLQTGSPREGLAGVIEIETRRPVMSGAVLLTVGTLYWKEGMGAKMRDAVDAVKELRGGRGGYADSDIFPMLQGRGPVNAYAKNFDDVESAKLAYEVYVPIYKRVLSGD